MTSFKIQIFTFLTILFLSFDSIAQMHYGVIQYEITVNMEKRFDTNNQMGNRRGGGNTQKYLKYSASLYFNDTMSIYVTEPLENIYQQNQTYMTNSLVNFNSGTIETQINLMGEMIFIDDKLPEYTWKFTNKERQIAGRTAVQAITQINDSTTIYAWFDTGVFPSVGPESYWNLPGAILGLAYEDGSVTYFATSISADFPDFNAVERKKKGKKVYNRADFDEEFSKRYDYTTRNHKLIRDMLIFY